MKLLHDLCEILRPFEEATNLTQGQNVVTAIEVIICVRSLCEQLSQLETKFKCRVLTSLQNSLEGRLSKFESMEIFQLATALDPMYKLDWCSDSEMESIKSVLSSKMKNIRPPESETRDQVQPPPKKKARPGLEFIRDRSSHQVKEMDDYFSLPRISDDDVLGFSSPSTSQFLLHQH